MKTYRYILFFLGLSLLMPAKAADAEEGDEGKFITISGVVKDRSDKSTLSYATISIPGNGAATVSNADGEFTFKIKEPVENATMKVSHLGYDNAYIRLDSKTQVSRTVWLTPSGNMLDEVIISGREPRSLVEEAIDKIPANYISEHCLLTGFYRENARKRKRYINVAEAVVRLDKSSYAGGMEDDKVQILKGRRLASPKPSDTLAVKLLGGPTSAVYLDIVKNPDLLLSRETLPLYDFHMEENVTINERPQYVVSFRPNRVLPYALYHGKLYIDRDRLSFTRAEFNLDISDRYKATQAILHKKPRGLRFKPVEVSYLVNYTEHDGKSYLSYVRNSIRFKCDWRRKLFSTGYTVLSEMAVTDFQITPAGQIPSRDAFSEKEVFSDNAALFFDKDFWGSYNIIKPEESLEDALDKLKKQYK